MLDPLSPTGMPAERYSTSPAARAVQGVFHWFIPPELTHNPEDGRRARLLVGVALALMISSAILFAVLLARGDAAGAVIPAPVMAVLVTAMPLMFAIAYLVRVTRSLTVPSVLLPMTLLALISHTAWYTGGYHSPLLLWMFAAPLMAAFLSGTRGTSLTSLAAGALLVYFYWATGHDLTETTEASASPLNLLRVQVLFLGLVTFVGWYYESSRYSRARYLIAASEQLESSNRALRLSQLNIKQIAENIGQSIWMYEADTERILYVNTGYEHLWQQSRSSLLEDPKAWHKAVHPADLDRIPTVADGEEHTYRLLMSDGKERWVRHVIYAVGDQLMQTNREIHIAADITLKRMAEQIRERFLETVLEVQEAERQHLARELHDETGQALTALLVGLSALEPMIENDKARRHTGMLRNQLRNVVGDIGRLARGLHPAVLDEMGLVAAVRRLAADMREVHGHKVNLTVVGIEDGERLLSTVELTVYRVIQESLANVAKHADANRVDITLFRQGDSLQFSVEDDGHGFDVKEAILRSNLKGGLGLFSMRERVVLLGGEMSMESSPGAGSSMLAEVPLTRTSADGGEEHGLVDVL